MKTSTRIIISIIVVVLGMYLYQYLRPTEDNIMIPPTETEISYSKKKVMLGSELFTLDIADTAELRERGLSNRTHLAPLTGMLFVFETPGVYQFWMKDMNFPIDILWLDQNKKVVQIEEALAPDTYPRSFGPRTLTQYVIEIGAGEARAKGIRVGDTIAFDLESESTDAYYDATPEEKIQYLRGTRASVYARLLRDSFTAYLKNGSTNAPAVKSEVISGKQCGLKAFSDTYYKSTFVVISLEPPSNPQLKNMMDATLIFTSKQDKIFTARIDTSTLKLLSFCDSDVDSNIREAVVSEFKGFLTDPAFAL